MTPLQTLSAILGLTPSIIAAIKAIEDAIPGSGKGEQKLAAVRSIMEIAYGQALAIWPVVEKSIGVLVGLFNATGTFHKQG